MELGETLKLFMKRIIIYSSPTDSLFRPVILNTNSESSFITKACNTFVLSWNEVLRIYIL